MPGSRVLVVEDDDAIRDAIVFFLEGAGYTVEAAATPDEALELARAHPPQVAVLDVMLPGMDGFDLAEMFRELPELAGTRIIFLTALADDLSRLRSFWSGGVWYLTKPFQKEDLLRCIESVVR
jgi:DNA-binding response OmpR family regulator